MTRTNRPRTGRTTYHRDGSVTVWDCVLASWVRGTNLSDRLFSTLDAYERSRVARHTAWR